MRNKVIFRRFWAVILSSSLGHGIFLPALAAAQAAPAASPTPAARQLGTVKIISGSTVTLANDTGKTVTVTVADGVRILQLSPGSTDLKTAKTITLGDIAVGDRILVTGKPGTADDTVTASRVILMKSTDIAEKHEAEQQEWRKNGTSGLVTAVQGTTFTVSSGAKKLTVTTSSDTIFRRYADDSVKFQDAKAGSATQIQTGDQVSVRGTKSGDGTSIAAAEIVSGSFRNLSGVISAVDSATGTITLKDLTTKQIVKVMLTANSDLRRIPPEAAARFAARTRGAASGTATPAGQAGATTPARPVPGTQPGANAAAAPASGYRPAGPAGSGDPNAPGGRGAGMDLSQMLTRLPTETIADIKPGDTVMIVASSDKSSKSVSGLTAVTMLNGVEPILAATPSGAAPLTLAPWNLGAAPEGGGGA